MRPLNIIHIVISIWFCAVFSIAAQNHSFYEEYSKISQSFSDNQNENNKIVDDIINNAKINNQYSVASKICFDYSLVSYFNQSYNEALKYVELSLTFKERIKEFDNDYKDSLFRAAYFSYFLSNYEESSYYYKKVIELNIDPKKIGQSYCGIGNNYYILNDYDKAIRFYTQGIKQLEILNEYSILSKQYVDLSNVFFEVGTNISLNKQLSFLKKAERLEKHIDIDLINRLRINNGLATVYGEKLNFNFEKAKYYSNENIRLSIENKLYDYTCTSYNNLSNIYNLKKEDSALYFAKQALKYCNRPISISLAHFQKGDYFKNLGNYNESLKNIQNGINHVIGETIKPYEDINLKYLKNNDLKYQLFFLIIEKNKLLKLQSKKQNDLKYIELALQHVLVTDSLVDIIQRETSNTTKLHWRLKASEVYTQGIEICHELNEPKTAFYLSEKGKSLLLTEGILNNNALTELPENIRLKEQVLKKTMIATNSELKENAFEAELEHETFMDSIKVAFPQYFKNQSLERVISLTKLQDTLNNNTIIMSYFWSNNDVGENMVYALIVSKNNIELLKIGDSSSISALLNNYLELIRKPLAIKEDRILYSKIAYQLYSKLIQPENLKTKLDNKDIVILPDGKLHNIPFEALTTSENSLDYLIMKNTISYAYSMSFLEHNKSIERKTENTFIGYAPMVFNNQNLSTLENSSDEIKKLSSITNGNIYNNELATKTSFLNNASNSKIIHLATHADATENPWIAFTDEKLNLQELYTFKNNAELAVLSSCSTSLGKIASGEGVMSLARGFFYSGSNSVVASLWNVNDKSTSFLMEDFYRNLKKGETKSNALRKAKINYIESHSLSEASPYYWSSFILLGNSKPIDFETEFTILHYFILGCLLLLIIFLFLRFKKK